MKLTPQQTRVTELLKRGLCNKLIAREMGIAESTVRTHLNFIYARMGVNKRKEVARLLSAEHGVKFADDLAA